jgi:hypothetical protein
VLVIPFNYLSSKFPERVEVRLKFKLLGGTRSDLALPDLLDAIVDRDATIRSIAGVLGNQAALPSFRNEAQPN